MGKWDSTGKRGEKGRWVICFNCNGHGKEYMYHGSTRFGKGAPCGWCEETGRRWATKRKRECAPSQKK